MHEYDKMLQWVRDGDGNRKICIETGGNLVMVHI